jgi:hypothetical protein
MEKAQKFLSDNPVYCGVMILAVGIVLFAACLFDWDWLFGNVNPGTYNTRKIDGLVNVFGRKTARIICGILSFMMIAGGLMWIWITLCK